MNKNQLANLFDLEVPKVKENPTAKVSFGLYLCKELVELVNGHISAESKSGVGATFTIRLVQD